MISLQRISVSMAKHYYDAADNYYTQEEGIRNSEWFGLGAQAHQLKGHVDPKTFQNLIHGRSTDGKTVVLKDIKRAGLDVTFSAPKSVSLAVLLGKDNRLEEAHRAAVRTALRVIEERIVQTREGSRDTRRAVCTGNALVAVFHHDSSRALDPQLHSHCVVLNRTRRADGKWLSVHNDTFFDQSKLLGLVYQNELALSAQKLGYAITVSPEGTFELSGYSRVHIEHFSKRTLAISALACQTKQEERLKKLKDRPKKGKAVSRSDLQEFWQDQALSLGIRHPKSDATLVHPPLRKQELAASAVRHASEREVRFEAQEGARFLLQAHLGRAPASAVLSICDRLGSSAYATPARESGLVATEQIAHEQAILALSRAATGRTPLCSGDLNACTEGLSAEQRAAVHGLLGSTSALNLWHGVAGAGKTFALARVRDALKEARVPLVALAPSAQAVQVLKRGLAVPGLTVARFLLQNQVDAGALVIVDESSFLSNRDARRLLEKAEQHRCRLLLVGDTRQLPGVEAGNPFALLRKSGVPCFELKTSRRQDLGEATRAALNAQTLAQNSRLKDVIRHFNEHRPHDAARALAPFVQAIGSEKVRSKTFARAVTQAVLSEDNGTLALVQTRKERNAITALVRKDLSRLGRLSDEISCTLQEPVDLTREEIRTRQPSFDTDIRTSGRGSFREQASSLARGDRVVFTANSSAHGYFNGLKGEVMGTGPVGLKVRSEAGIFHFDVSKPLPLRHGYVSTVHSAQGDTCDRVLLLCGGSADAKALYTAVSRARIEVQIIAPSETIQLKVQEKATAVLSLSSKIRI